MMKQSTINLEDYRTPGSKVFTGRDRGLQVRELSKITELEETSDNIEILVPTDIRSINPSFLEEFLFKVVKKLGAEGFKKKIKFLITGRYNIDSDLEEAVERILRSENALSK